jgi:arylsulfatase A-like enzyme
LLPERLECFPQLLGDSDYRTGYYGKWHLGHEFQPQRGFDEWLSIIDGKWMKTGVTQGSFAMSDYAKFLVAQGMEPKYDQKEPFSKHFISRLPLELSRVKFLETKAADFLQRHQHDRFVLFVAFYEPHPPYNGPLNNEHPLAHVDLAPTFGKIFGDDMPDRYRQRQVVQAKTIAGNAEAYRKIKQHYLGLVTEVDRSIGTVLTKLDQLGLAENTVVVHTSDHGEMMGAHGLFEKSVMYEEALHVPYLLRLPGQNRAQRIASPVSHIDLVPTLLDLLGAPAHEQPVGRSRAALLQNPAEQTAETIFAQWNGRDNVFRKSGLTPTNETALRESTRAAISADGWKLCLRDLDKKELYNMRDDPREEHNLYSDPRHSDVVARFTREIHEWQERTNDSLALQA